LREQKLKESVPAECFLSTVDPQKTNDDSFLKSIGEKFNSLFKHKATSEKCLEYYEALRIDRAPSNILMEAFVYTITETMRPLVVSSGQFINNFYGALAKDLSFYQSIPLLAVFTIIFVPFSMFLFSLLSLLLFNYEFNFFHLVSFKKSHKATNDNEKIKEESVKEILNVLKREMISISKIDNDKFIETLPIKSGTSKQRESDNDSDQDLNSSLNQKLQSYIELTKRRENELLQRIKYFKNIEIEKENDIQSAMAPLQSINPSNEHQVTNKKIVSIGMSRNIHQNVHQQHSSPDNNITLKTNLLFKEEKKTKNTIYQQQQQQQQQQNERPLKKQNIMLMSKISDEGDGDDDEEEEDIYVILDEN
jgi:hypothetical protein